MRTEVAYRRASQVAVLAAAVHVFLAAQREATAQAAPRFLFRGRLADPLLFRDSLLTISEVVAARFFMPQWSRLADPVVTCEPDTVRLEGLSSDACAYLRVDLTPGIFEACELGQRGTTNVDFGPEFCARLAGLRPGRAAQLEIGEDSVALRTEAAETVERRVTLPDRWLRGFLQVQALQRVAEPVLALERAAARRLVAGLPGASTASGRRPWQVTEDGRLAREGVGRQAAVSLRDPHRLRLLQRAAGQLSGLRVWQVPGGSTFWVAEMGPARLTLGLSGAASQGFSGEGQALVGAPQAVEETVLERARAWFAGGGQGDVAALAAALGSEPALAERAADLLGEQGLLGYDLAAGVLYHRALPYVVRTGFATQARETSAQQLAGAGRVELELHEPRGSGLRLRGWVKGDTATYLSEVSLDADGRIVEADCTCEWFLRHGLSRGPCKHLLALRQAGSER